MAPGAFVPPEMQSRLCRRCKQVRPMTSFETFQSGRVRATCERCISRDNSPISRTSTAVQPCIPNLPPAPIIDPWQGKTTPLRHVHEAHTINHPQTHVNIEKMPLPPLGYSSGLPTDPGLASGLAPPEHAGPGPICENTSETLENMEIPAQLMPSCELLASLKPDLRPLLESLNEHGSFVLLYIPCKAHNK